MLRIDGMFSPATPGSSTTRARVRRTSADRSTEGAEPLPLSRAWHARLDGLLPPSQVSSRRKRRPQAEIGYAPTSAIRHYGLHLNQVHVDADDGISSCLFRRAGTWRRVLRKCMASAGKSAVSRFMNTRYCRAFSIAPVTTADSGSIAGSKRAITLPLRSTRNFVKFHWISPPVAGLLFLSVRNW